MKVCRKVATILFLCVGAVCVSAGMAAAQVVSSGAFTLQHEAQWGKYTLPEGHYNYTIRDMGMKGARLVTIKTANSSRQFEMMGLERTPAASIKGTDNAVIVTQGANSNYLRGIYLASSNVEYVFSGYAKKRSLASEKSVQEVATRVPISKANKR